MTTIPRVAILFDAEIRSGTTGAYCYRAMQELAEVTHFSPDELSHADFAPFDLVLHIDDGLRYPLPHIETPTAYWAIDTHLDLGWAIHRSREFDLVFAAQQDGAEKLKQAGMTNAEWLPLACDPDIHCRKEVTNRYDIAFVGHNFPGERQSLLEQISERYTRSFIGQADYREMATIYSASKIVFNRSLKNDINMRVFEANHRCDQENLIGQHKGGVCGRTQQQHQQQ